MPKKANKNIVVSIPIPEAADLAIRAAGLGMSLQVFCSVLVLTAAYGPLHPVVRDSAITPKSGSRGPKTPTRGPL